MNPIKFFVAVLIPLLFLSLPLRAGEFQLDTSILSQIREDVNDITESPVNGYLGLAIDQPKWNISAETNMRLFRDFHRDWDDYDLYQAVLHIYPADILQIDFGRQFISQGFSTETLDGLRFGIDVAKHVNLSLYSGMPRSVEIGDFNENDGLLSGLSIGLQDVSHTNAQLHATWRKYDIRRDNLRENDVVKVGVNLSHRWDNPVPLMLYGLFEYDVTGKVIDAGTAGVDIYPADRLALNVEFNYFNIDRESNQQTILSLFTQGRTMMGRLAATLTLVPDLVDLVTNVSYQRLEIQQDAMRNGYLVDVGLPFFIEDINLSITPQYYFSRSFGGTLHGARVSFYEQFTKEFYGDLFFDYTTYDKITNDDDDAYSVNAWAGYEILKGWTVAGGVEYNRNNTFLHDIRGSMKIEYRYDRKI